jgi:hypothetical protein
MDGEVGKAFAVLGSAIEWVNDPHPVSVSALCLIDPLFAEHRVAWPMLRKFANNQVVCRTVGIVLELFAPSFVVRLDHSKGLAQLKDELTGKLRDSGGEFNI